MLFRILPNGSINSLFFFPQTVRRCHRKFSFSQGEKMKKRGVCIFVKRLHEQCHIHQDCRKFTDTLLLLKTLRRFYKCSVMFFRRVSSQRIFTLLIVVVINYYQEYLLKEMDNWLFNYWYREKSN